MVAVLTTRFPSVGEDALSPDVGAAANDEEQELIAHAKVDRGAFEILYRRYVDPIYRYCYRRLGSKEAAEDATSLVFAKALAALPRYHDGPFRSWLFVIAHNVISDTFRRERPDQPLTAATEVADPEPSPEELAVAADQTRWLQRLLTQLPPDQRRVIELRLSGLTGPEISQVLGRHPTAIRSAQSRAIGRLRGILGATVRPEEAHDA